MKKIITVLIVMIVIIVGAYFVLNENPEKNIDNVQILPDNEIKLTGIVVPGGQDSCPVDGICSIMVGKYEIIWAKGWPQEPRGTMDNKIQIGDEVNVYGGKLDKKTITIYGKESYYIQKDISEK